MGADGLDTGLDEAHAEEAREARAASVAESTEKVEEMAKPLAAARNRLRIATGLVSSLQGQKQQWVDALAELQERFETLVGDSLLGAALVIYLSPLKGRHRAAALSEWGKLLDGRGIRRTPRLPMHSVLASPTQVARWTQHGLASDGVSPEEHELENVAIVMREHALDGSENAGPPLVHRRSSLAISDDSSKYQQPPID